MLLCLRSSAHLQLRKGFYDRLCESEPVPGLHLRLQWFEPQQQDFMDPRTCPHPSPCRLVICIFKLLTYTIIDETDQDSVSRMTNPSVRSTLSRSDFLRCSNDEFRFGIVCPAVRLFGDFFLFPSNSVHSATSDTPLANEIRTS